MNEPSQTKSGLVRILVPGAIALIVALLIVGIFLVLPGNSSRSAGSAKSTAATTKTAAQTAAPAVSSTSGTATAQTVQATSADTLSPPAFDITTRTAQPPLDSEADYLKWMLAHTPEKESYLKAKWARAQAIVARKDATDPRIIEAFLRAPREFFCRTYNMPNAYADAAMPIGFGQTISGPHLVSHMTQALDPQPDQKVLEVGTGSGYQSSFLSELSNHVYTIEIVKQLYEETNAIYDKWTKDYPEYANIKRENADGYYGWAKYAPFDRIIVTAGIDHIPPDLLKQLAPGGIMVIPVGPPSGQTVLKITKEVAADGSVTFKREDIYHGLRKVIFVPFTSKNGIHSTATDAAQGNP